MISIKFIWLGSVIALLGSLSYARDTLRGVTQPNRVTWFMWSLAPLLASVAEIRQGVGLQWVMSFVVGFGPLLVLIASFISRGGSWKIGPFDIACGVASVFGLIGWAVTSNNTVALLCFVTADALACLPTLQKSWTHPETESVSSYIATGIYAVLTLATVHLWTTAAVTFPIWIGSINTVFTVLIAGKLGPRLTKRSLQR